MPILDLPPQQAGFDADQYSWRYKPPAIERAIAPAPVDPENMRKLPLADRYLALTSEREPLRFLEAPEIWQDHFGASIFVPGWDITLPAPQLIEVKREMARKFLRLWQDSEHQRLNKEDETAWFHIVHAVDMDAFHRSLERPRYLEGQLAGSKERPMVRWSHDENFQAVHIPQEFASQLNLLNKGEWFGGHFLINEDDKILHLERVVPIPEPADSEEFWDGWLTPAS